MPQGDLEEFQNISEYRFFTNNIWIRLDRLRELMRSGDNHLNYLS